MHIVGGHHPPNRLKTPISYVVTGFDVNVLVGSCLIGMLSSVFGLRNTQQMNASLNKVEIYSFVPFFIRYIFIFLLHCQPFHFPILFVVVFVILIDFSIEEKFLITITCRQIKNSWDYVQIFRCIQMVLVDYWPRSFQSLSYTLEWC